MIHPPRLSALLLAGTLAAAPAAAQVPVTVDASHLRALQGRLDGFAAALPAEERALWERVLLRAALAPSATAEVRVSPILQIGPGGGCDDPQMPDAAGRVAIVVQGGRTAGASGIVVQGGRTGTPGGPTTEGSQPGTPAAGGIVVQGGRTPSGRGGIVVQGGRTPSGAAQGANAPRPNPTGTVAIGPKQDDPGAPRPQTGTVAIGPKQDDPAPPPQSLGRRLAAFSAQLPAEERSALEWLLTRAAAAPEGRPGTPGGLPQGTSVSLRQALGIDVLAIGPKQDDPAPPPPTQRWILRY